jgi:hypothetical protein
MFMRHLNVVVIYLDILDIFSELLIFAPPTILYLLNLSSKTPFSNSADKKTYENKP